MRSPRWLVEVVAWAAAGVLAVGVGVVATGAVEPPREAVEVALLPQVDVAAQRTVAVAPALEPDAPALAEVPPPPVVADPSLGPPPGPEVDLVPERTAAPADRYALLVGVTDYRSPTKDTIGSVNDVRFIAAALERAGWRPENVRVLTDEQVTGDALREGLAWLAERSRPGTFALLHYSGHVKQLGGGTEALWPVDRDFVRDGEVTALLSASAGRMWVDVAGCEAGSFLPGLPSDRVLVSTSSNATEKSYEYPPWAMSVWAGLVFDQGLARGGADADRDGRTTIGETLRWSTYYAQAITLTQQPYGRQTPQVQGDPVRGWTLDAPPA